MKLEHEHVHERGIVGRSRAIGGVLRRIEAVSAARSTVLTRRSIETHEGRDRDRAHARDVRRHDIERKSASTPMKVDAIFGFHTGRRARRASMHIRLIARPCAYSLIALFVLSGSATLAAAQSHDEHGSHETGPAHKRTPEENALVQAVRDATERFRNVTSVDGPGEGYELSFGCVSGGEFGAMGLHYVKMPLVFDGEIDVANPEIILFEPTRHGGIRITGADYVVIADAWNGNPEHTGPPELDGQLFHLFDAPNRFGLPAFYTLHVWAWKDNPNGTFVNWNPDVSCDAFNDPSFGH